MLWLGRTCHIKVSTKKAVVLQQLLLSKYHEYFSQKKRIISSDDQPYFSEKLARMKRKKCRGYSRNRKSLKQKNLNAIHVEELSKAKRNFYKRKIKNLKTSNPNNGIEHQCGRIFEILWELNFPVNNFARDNGKIAPRDQFTDGPCPVWTVGDKDQTQVFLRPYKDSHHILVDTIKLIKDWCYSFIFIFSILKITEKDPQTPR